MKMRKAVCDVCTYVSIANCVTCSGTGLVEVPDVSGLAWEIMAMMPGTDTMSDWEYNALEQDLIKIIKEWVES